MASRPGARRRDAGKTAALAHSLTLGFLVLLDSLGPYARVAFILGDVFGEPYPAIAEILRKSEPACRQLVSRARRKLHAARGGAGSSPPAAASAELLEQLMDSVLAGDEKRTLSLLHPDVVLISDAGLARRAARHPIVGAERVRQLLKASRGLLARSGPEAAVYLVVLAAGYALERAVAASTGRRTRR